MSYTVLRTLDLFFVVFHTAFVVFILAGWIPGRSRRVHRYAVGATAISWFGIGLFTTIGYCPLTDWHWRVLRALGETGLPRSYVQYLIIRLIGLEVDAMAVDIAVAAGFALACVLACALWVLEQRVRRGRRRPPPARPLARRRHTSNSSGDRAAAAEHRQFPNASGM